MQGWVKWIEYPKQQTRGFAKKQRQREHVEVSTNRYQQWKPDAGDGGDDYGLRGSAELKMMD